jgi:DNA modification methylase
MARRSKDVQAAGRQKAASAQLSVQYVPLQDLRPDPKNPRVHSERQIQLIAKSISAFGFNVPILADAALNVIAGHGRLSAAKLLHIEKVPVITLENLTEQQRRAYVIADNRLSEVAEWNEDLLGEQLKILSEANLSFSLESVGFEVAEVDMFIENLTSASDAKNDPADLLPELVETEVSKIGDVWELGKCRVLCGNALTSNYYSSLMNKQKASITFCDPPFNVPIAGHAGGNGKIQHREFPMASGEMSREEYVAFLTDALTLVARHSRKGSIHFICMDWRHIGELLAAGTEVYSELKNLCVWTKDNSGMGSFYRSQHELIFVFQNGAGVYRNNIQLGRFGRTRTNVWHYPGVNSFARTSDEGNLLALHPTVKPVALISDAILDCSARGEIVLDAFLGSGSSLIAAERTGRICYGIELDPLYVDTCVRRWQKFTGLEAFHRQTGKTFSQCEEEVRNVKQ